MFTLAHLSDPHLAPLPQPRWSELFDKRITGYINWQRKRRFIHDPAVLAKIVADLKAQKPDHIAVTGDIVNLALPVEFAQARAWLESLGDPRDVTFVPGNHDAYVAGAIDEAIRTFAPYMTGEERAFPFFRLRGPLVLIGVATGEPTPWGMATGRVGPAQLGGLMLLLSGFKRRGTGIPRVILIHHPPVSQAARHKRLTDAAAFKRIVAAHGAELILHGHDHRHMLNWLDGPGGTRVPAVGVPSASAAPGTSRDAAAYNLYRFDGASGAMSCEMISRGIDAEGTVVEQKRMMLFG